VQQVQPPPSTIDHEFEEMKWALNMSLIGTIRSSNQPKYYFVLIRDGIDFN
jgi:hypothetical protein